MTGLLLQAGLLILKSLAEFLSILLLLRFHMQVCRVPFNNQIGAFVLQLTNWLVMPMRKVIPGVYGLDLASILATYLLQIIVIIALISLRSGLEALPPETMILLILSRSVLAVLRMGIYLLIGLLIAQAIFSWVSPYSPLSRPVGQMTQPILRPIQRIVPPVANIDLSPLIVILLAQIVLIFL
jgi:YggT family protein